MAIPNRNNIVHTLFDIGVIAKAADGMLEITGGVLLFFISPGQIHGLLHILTQHELSEDPHDLLAGLLMRSVQHLSMGTEAFAAVFLLWHGAVKVGVVWALWRRKFWAYPIAIGAFGLFLAYQLYRYSHTHSVWLLMLSFLDLFVIVLTWLEYQRLRHLHEFSKTP